MIENQNRYFEKREGNIVALMTQGEEEGELGYEICSFAAKQSVKRSGDDFELKSDQSRDWSIQSLNYNDFDLNSCNPPIMAQSANEFFAQLSKKFFSISFPPPAEKRIIKFVKAGNGNVLLMKMDNTLIASFASNQSVVKDLNRPDMFMILSETAYNLNPLVFNYQEVWGELCQPAIENSTMDSLLNALSQDFFFDKDLSAVQQVSVNNFPKEGTKFFKVYDSPQYRGNVYGFTSVVRTPYVVQSVLNIANKSTIAVWSMNHFNNQTDGSLGASTMPQDFAENRLFPMSETFQLNGMYVKITSTFNYYGGKYHLVRIYQDVRTNEVYLMVNSSDATGTYVPFDFGTVKAVDGGFEIYCNIFSIKVEIRNKFF